MSKNKLIKTTTKSCKKKKELHSCFKYPFKLMYVETWRIVKHLLRLGWGKSANQCCTGMTAQRQPHKSKGAKQKEDKGKKWRKKKQQQEAISI